MGSEERKYEGSGLNGHVVPLNEFDGTDPSNTGIQPRLTVPEHESTPEVLSENEDYIDEDDAHSLIGVSISRAATRLASGTTPAAEKAAAMEGGHYFEEPEGYDDTTPPAESPTLATEGIQKDLAGQQKSGANSIPMDFPSPWIAGPRPLVFERPEATRSALRDAFGTTKRRSFSGGAESLKKLLPSMPSLPKVGGFISALPFSEKSRSRGASTSSRFAGPSPHPAHITFRDPTGSTADQLPSGLANSSTLTIVANEGAANPHPRGVRRVASDDSLLYYSLSRASSLGDDTRFESHHEMVNSRFKAIRDSLQDRKSFRLPSMPNMPSFYDAMNFIYLGGDNRLPRTQAEFNTTIKEGQDRRVTGTPNSVVSSGMVGASVSQPRAVVEEEPELQSRSDDALDRAIAHLTGDIVIMGGYRGSILRSAKPPHRQLWVPVKVGLNIRKVNMEVGLNPEDEENMEDHIFASGMIQNVGPVDISRRLFKRLRESENAKSGKLRVWDYGYDWRLSPHLLSRKLVSFLETLPSNNDKTAAGPQGALVIAHSLGGLITRHAVNKRPELFSGVVFAGVPQSCVNILGPLRNGDAVLLSSRVLTAQVNFTLRTSFALLPLDGYCYIDKYTKEEYPVDFFNVDDWIKYRFSPCTDPPLPPKAPPTSILSDLLRSSSFTNLQLPGKKGSNQSGRSRSSSNLSSSNIASLNVSSTYLSSSPDRQRESHPSPLANAAEAIHDAATTDRTIAPQMGGQSNPVNRGHSASSSISTLVTIPRSDAITYLRRTLAETKAFKIELAHCPSHATQNRYPPFAVIYGKSVPTVYAAKVDGRDGIPCADVYDDLAFKSGDGVCLAKEAMLPVGYEVVKGGRISSDRGHVTLLGDLYAVGTALEAVIRGRTKGLGLGPGAALRGGEALGNKRGI